MDIISKITHIDRELFLYLNSKHSTWLDPIMLVVSSFPFWIITALSIAIYAVYKNRLRGGVFSIFMLLSIGVNNLINHIVKNIVERSRPIHVEMWNDVIHAIEKYDVSYSFFSAHSSNSFTLAVFALLYFKNKYFTPIILFWASIVAYSRIYLGKHYPLDVLTGIAVGSIMGVIGYNFFEYYNRKKLSPRI